MSWAGLASNQTVSFNNLQDAVNTAVFTAITTIPVSSEQITKADAAAYVNIDTAYAPYAAKASNQLVVKSDLVPGCPPFGTFLGQSCLTEISCPSLLGLYDEFADGSCGSFVSWTGLCC